MRAYDLTIEEYLVYINRVAQERFKGDRGLALLELELEGFLDSPAEVETR